MELKIFSSTPENNEPNVRCNPLIISLNFNDLVDKTSVEKAIKIEPQPKQIYYSWEEKEITVRGVNHSNSPFKDVPIGSRWRHHVLSICITDYDRGFTSYNISIKKTISGVNSGTLANDFTLSFRTRPQSCDIIPANAKYGDSRADSIESDEYKRAIVLSGGGAKGAFQVGALRYLYEVEGFYPDLLIGTSVGAINVLKLAESATIEEHKTTIKELEESWMRIRYNRDILEETKELKELGSKFDDPSKLITDKISVIENLGAIFLPAIGALFVADAIEDAVEEIMVNTDKLRKTSGLNSFDPLLDNINSQRFKANIEKVTNNKKIHALVGVVDLKTGRSQFINKDKTSDFIKGVIASASMPVIFETIKMDDAVYVDGGVKDVAGLDQAIRMGATDIVVIPTYHVGSNPHLPKLNDNLYDGLINVLERSIGDLVFDEVLANDIISVVNKQIVLNHFAGQDVRIRVIDPNHLFHDTLTFHPESAKRNIQYGYLRAKEVIEKEPITNVMHPCEQTGTSSYLVVEPSMNNFNSWHDSIAFHEHTGGLSEVFPKNKVGNVRIIVKENNEVIHTYPSDFLNSYSSVTVPGSDPDLISPMNPYLKGKRKGLFYAFPLHANNDGVFNTSNSSARPTNLNVEIIVSDLKDGKYSEVRANKDVRFEPDRDGIMKLPIEVPFLKKTSPSNTVMLQMRSKVFNKKKTNSPDEEALGFPRMVIHGFGSIANLSELAGHDGSLEGDNGRWESSRDIKYIYSPNPRANMDLSEDSMQRVGFSACSILALNTEVVLYEQIDFKGKSMRIQLFVKKDNPGTASVGGDQLMMKINNKETRLGSLGLYNNELPKAIKNILTNFGMIRSVKINKL